MGGWRDFTLARWHLMRGRINEARRLMEKAIGGFPAVNRRYLFWLLTRGSWAYRLPAALRQRLGIALRISGLETR